ncbi:MAG TPA: membrane protein insertion efficiency factor YidD, partial [Bryobacteraceae bacterium]
MRQTVIVVLRAYKRFISPFLPSACRFHPTCSEYMMEAVHKYGAARG